MKSKVENNILNEKKVVQYEVNGGKQHTKREKKRFSIKSKVENNILNTKKQGLVCCMTQKEP